MNFQKSSKKGWVISDQEKNLFMDFFCIEDMQTLMCPQRTLRPFQKIHPFGERRLPSGINGQKISGKKCVVKLKFAKLGNPQSLATSFPIYARSHLPLCVSGPN